MAGHSKWAQIKRKKAVTDRARSRVFGKYARLITVEAKRAQGDTTDPALRAIIERAKMENMPKDAIERAIAKGISSDTSTLEFIRYETYGPGGVAILIDTLTDSRNRTAAEIKHLLTKNGYELAAPGSAVWAFSCTHDVCEPTSTVTVSETDGVLLSQLIEMLDEQDDVQNVYTNAE